MNMQNLAFGFLAATAVGGLAWVFIYPLLSGERQAAARREQVAKPEPAARRADNKVQKSRREQVEGSLKELEARAKENKLTLANRLMQAGLNWSEQKFWIISAVLGVIGCAAAFVVSGSLPGTIGMAFATEAGQFQEAGLSAIVCGPGSIAQAHQPDEFIEISQMEAGQVFLRKLVAWAQEN